MNALIILVVLFSVVALMVILIERFAKPVDEQQQAKYSKLLPILVFIMLITTLIKTII